MREIKFRGMSLSGEWHYGLLANIEDEWFISNRAGSPRAFRIRPETQGQFTGLKDKNGVDIYESDIIKDTLTPRAVVWHEERCSFVATRTLGYSKNQPFVSFDCDKACEGKVLGNIYENPELLEEAQ